jgi:hypothetical protein
MQLQRKAETLRGQIQQRATHHLRSSNQNLSLLPKTCANHRFHHFQDTVVNAHRPSQIPSVAANPRSAADFVPRLGGPTASWAPPRQPLGLTPRPAGLTPRVYPVGYSGHVPGLIAGNLHGALWRDLLTPRSDVASPRRLLATPRSATLRPPASAPAGGARTPRLTSSSRLSVDLYCG